ncbi:MAG: polysaccharide deacetylase family protein [Clostridia bacterium]|nr:polysaccharide deacetylase family protein [Clostridia bacterium]MDD4408572.1 polysaccharide deacetylase family protein [Clostridia bacterium]
MKILYMNIKSFKSKRLRGIITNLVIVAVLITVFAFSYAGGTLRVFNSEVGTQAIYQGNVEGKNVALMINVYWGDEFIQPLLDVIEDKQVKCTFFVGGVWAAVNEDLIKEIIEKNCEIGNHGYLHKSQDKLSEQESHNEINKTHQIIKSTTGIEMKLFAPPSGAYTNKTVEIAKDLGYKTIMWTRDTIDWRDQDENLIYTRAIKNVQGGDLILMHPTGATLKAFPRIIDYLKKNNFNVTTVSEALS